jgi:hypothetical protein
MLTLSDDEQQNCLEDGSAESTNRTKRIDVKLRQYTKRKTILTTIRVLIIITILAFITKSCSNNAVVLAAKSVEAYFNRAIEYYKNGDFNSVISLLDRYLVTILAERNFFQSGTFVTTSHES